MPFTATCRISGTIWDKPSGCPVISPSNWQIYVLDNACVIARHDHGATTGTASTGEGQLLPGSWFPAIDSDQFSAFFPIASSNWARTGNGNYMFSGVVDTSTQYATVAYDVYLRSGTYTLRVLAGCGPGFGILTACINGSAVGTIDCYRATSETANNNASISITASGAGEKSLVFAPDTKNVSSTGYTARLSWISLVRTGN